MTKYNKYDNIIPPTPKAPKISLHQVYKYNRIYSEGKLRVDVYENDSKYYLVFKGKITTFPDYDQCFAMAKQISETGR
jgi:hypothetical protein